MWNRRPLFWSGGIILVVGIGLTALLVAPTPGISDANISRIRPGMSRKQVHEILGGPAQQTKMYNAGRDWVDIWVGEEGKARVLFQAYRVVGSGQLEYFADDRDWLVVRANFQGPRSFWSHLRRALSR